VSDDEGTRPRRWTFALRPGWLALYVAVIAACIAMVELGRWQWHVAHVRHGAIQNYAYAFQWWAFTIFAVLMAVRLLRDARYRADVHHVPPPSTEPEPPVAYRRYVMPQSSTSTPQPTDGEHAAYNAYLARYAAEHREDAR